MLDRGHHICLCSGVAGELIRDHHTRPAGLPLQQLAKQALGGLLVAPALDQDIEHDPVLVDGPPEHHFARSRLQTASWARDASAVPAPRPRAACSACSKRPRACPKSTKIGEPGSPWRCNRHSPASPSRSTVAGVPKCTPAPASACELLRRIEPEPEFGQAGLLIALDTS